MIAKLSHTPIYVFDQDEAKKFYTEKLGFEVRNDSVLEDFRWLTVSPKNQPDFEIILMPIQAGFMYDEESANQLKDLLKKGVLGAGVFKTNDCKATYEELKNKDVEFLSPPQDRPYGVEAVFKDNSGNWFSLTQEKE